MIDKQKPILVTGGTGLVGSYLLRHLLDLGYENISALKRTTSNMHNVVDIASKIHWIEGDITNIYDVEDALSGKKQIYHCAAMVSYDSRDYDQLMLVNVEGTENVINVALESDVEKLVFVSSIAAVGKDKNQHTINEKSKWVRTPYLTPYAISKYLSEQVVWRGAAEGLNVAIVNPAIILGSADWQDSSTALFKQVWDGLKFYPTGTTGFVDVRDIVTFMHLLMNSDIKEERFILAAENQSYKTLFTLMSNALGKKTPSIKVTPFLSGIAWRLEWLKSKLTGKKTLITKQTATVSAQTYHFDNAKSLKQFDFKYIPIEKSIAEIAECMKKSAQNDWKMIPLPNK